MGKKSREKGVLLDHWAARAGPGVPAARHVALAQFVAERFRRIHAGPMTPMVGNTIFPQLTVKVLMS